MKSLKVRFSAKASRHPIIKIAIHPKIAQSKNETNENSNEGPKLESNEGGEKKAQKER
jgi:hypothetical protein